MYSVHRSSIGSVADSFSIQTVACTTYLVQPGFFDIFFPTDFHLLRDLYALLMSPSSSDAPPPSTPSSSSSPRVSTDFFSPHTRRAEAVTGASSGRPVRGLVVSEHGDFLERWGETEMTRLSDGNNPMIEFYKNAQFIC